MTLTFFQLPKVMGHFSVQEVYCESSAIAAVSADTAVTTTKPLTFDSEDLLKHQSDRL